MLRHGRILLGNLELLYRSKLAHILDPNCLTIREFSPMIRMSYESDWEGLGRNARQAV